MSLSEEDGYFDLKLRLFPHATLNRIFPQVVSCYMPSYLPQVAHETAMVLESPEIDSSHTPEIRGRFQRNHLTLEEVRECAKNKLDLIPHWVTVVTYELNYGINWRERYSLEDLDKL